MNRQREVGELPHWDLSHLFPGLDSAKLTTAIESVGQRLDDLAKFVAEEKIGTGARNQGEPDSDPARPAGNPGDPGQLGMIVAGFLELMNA